MNSHHIPRALGRAIPLALTLAAALATSGAAETHPVRAGVFEKHVRIRGVDFANADDVAALHRQLARAAAEVCDSRPPLMLSMMASDRGCARAALRRAVADIDQPSLTALDRHQRAETVASR